MNGQPFFSRFNGLSMGEVESIQIPVQESQITTETPFTVTAKVKLPEPYTDAHPGNNQADISLNRKPEG